MHLMNEDLQKWSLALNVGITIIAFYYHVSFIHSSSTLFLRYVIVNQYKRSPG